MQLPTPGAAYDPHTTVPLGLDTADRLARGELCAVMFNRRYTYRLTKHEWPIYEAAKQTGYLVMPRSDNSYRRLEYVWLQWCEARDWPAVLLKPRIWYASVEADTIMIPWSQQPTEAQTEPIRHLFEEHARGGWWCVNPTFYCISRAPIALAPFIASRIVAVLWRALGLPSPQSEVN